MSETPGIILKNRRESKNLNIAQVVKRTRIRAHYIQAMEADDFASLPSPVQARGFLRVYAEFLELDANDLISSLEPHSRFFIQQTTDKPNSNVDSDKLDGIDLIPPSSPATVLLATINTPPEPSDNHPIEEENGLQFETESVPIQSPESLAPSKSKYFFFSIGEQLRLQREALGLSLNEVEKHSHVLRRYLESIEAGDFENLPSSVQARGMLINYARFLEIDLEEILLRFADGLQAQLLERQQPNHGIPGSSFKGSKQLSAFKRFISIDMLFGGGLIILLIVFAVWGTGRVIDLYKPPASLATAASISDIILTPLQSATIEGLDLTQPALLLTNTPAANFTQISGIPTGQQGQVQVYVVVLQRTWLRIIVDGEILLEGRVEPGSAYPFSGNNQVEVLTGNGSALQIIYNQADQGVMGIFGEVVDRIYTQNSILEPTATITPTPTITPKPSLTPHITKTPVPTRTLIFSPTPLVNP
ncbi:MAG: hypothetical protein A2X25_03940 [Chloroflexi bacterium GWB2_49_20]|nr:MAG: hypothetical protein A2X25_03940 [Chloroflexi bacterium GWB2_49_20]OGN76735.1 MAG: hypothetical protein A2X26_11030 [Chloroflexi bacterium GWC2_49_37]OGN83695.1 MAG: hypothetical protein A2X27_01685 [Chloroflexi bacterium GWD2_49_16]HBG74182.1 hypothetical protein [Anaerolineae bacterium]HCC79000.1 hypothetical protein [Anaerolineae bacterium]